MKRVWKKDAVSPVIAVILMVAITVVLAAVLYVTVQNLTQQQTQSTPSASLQCSESTSAPGNYTIHVVSPSQELLYKNVYITIGTATIGDPTAGMASTTAAGTPANGTATYTKVAGATSMTAGDELSLTTTAGDPWGGKEVRLIWIPSGGLIGTVTVK